MAESTTSVAAAPQARHAEASLLDQIVEQSKVARSDVEHARAKDIISELVREVMQGTVVVSDNLSVTLDARVAELDRLMDSGEAGPAHRHQRPGMAFRPGGATETGSGDPHRGTGDGDQPVGDHRGPGKRSLQT